LSFLAVKKDPIRDPASSAKGSEGAVVAVPDVVPQLVEGTAKYSRNCTASVRYKCNPGPALMRERGRKMKHSTVSTKWE
jgi:hypothetical protein